MHIIIDSIVYCKDKTILYVINNNILKIYSTQGKATIQQFLHAEGNWARGNIETRANYELYKQLQGPLEKKDFDKVQNQKYTYKNYCTSIGTLCYALSQYSRLPHDNEIKTTAKLLTALDERLANATPQWILQETYRLQGRDPSILHRARS
ncbi:MAG: hypothetical protein HY363_00270 [Candidatus Aenigmarchaeota archaeon]|nr:hypothetical protein [Candidatus Aenigmarchaeota archaeon]